MSIATPGDRKLLVVIVGFSRQLTGVFLLGFLAICTCLASACDVPVFRYALERWASAPYELVVLHRGPLSGGARNVFARLDGDSDEGIPHPNLRVRTVDLAQPGDPSPKQVWREMGRPELPCMILHYPGVLGIERAIWSGPVTASNTRLVVDSPARGEVARRILEGHSAVWVLLRSGDAAKDEAAEALLERSLAGLEQSLELPAVLAPAPLDRDQPGEETGPPLQVRFSLLSVSRTDPAESVFIGMLLRSEADLDRYSSQPIAFPVYGRGRALYALVGKGITHENVREACAFLVGPCMCEAKALNPGTDLLMVADWDAGLVGSLVEAVESQPLVGMGTLSEAARVAQAAAPARKASAQTSNAVNGRPRTPAPTPEASPGPDVAKSPPDASAEAPKASASVYGDAAASSPEPSSRLLRNMLIAMGLIAAVTTCLVMLISRRAPKERP